MKLRINDWLTLTRVLLTPFILYCFYAKCYTIGIILYMICSITDVLDGYIARKLKTESKFVKVMDPLADKWLALSMLIMLVDMKMIYMMPVIYIILFREIIVMGLRTISKTKIINSSWMGKLKTLTLGFAIFFLLLQVKIHSNCLYHIGNYLLLFAGILASISGVKYFITFSKNLEQNMK